MDAVAEPGVPFLSFPPCRAERSSDLAPGLLVEKAVSTELPSGE
jgi:hypothetical protein